MESGQIERIKAYAKTLNKTMNDEGLLDSNIQLALDRLLIYLNVDEIDKKLEPIVAQAIAESYRQAQSRQEGKGEEPAIKSINDNGQSITYGDTVRSSFAQATDQELWGGYQAILARYRRVNVVT